MARESFWGSIITYLGVSLGFVTTFFVLTSYLRPEEIGLTRLLVELATLLSGLGMLGMSTSISRYYPYFASSDDSPKEGLVDRGFFGWTMRIASIGLPLALALYLLMADVLNPIFGKGSLLLKTYYPSILPLTVFVSLWAVAELYAIQLMRLAVPRIIRELVLRLLLLVAYAVYALGWVSLTGFVAVFVGAYGLCMCLAFVYLSRITKLSLQTESDFPSPQLKRSFVRYTLLAVASVVGTTLAGRMDILLLGILPGGGGLKSAGVYTIGFFMVSIVEIPTRAIIGLATARFAHLMKEQNAPATQSLLEAVNRYQLLTSLVLYLLIYASIDPILSLMPAAQDYASCKPIFLILGLAKLVEVAFTSSHPIINASRYYHYSLYYTLWCVLSAFLANYYLIPLWDVKGAALATLLTNILGYGLLQLVLIYRLKLKPLSWTILRVVLMGAILALVLPYLPQHANPFISIALRSTLLGLGAVMATLLLRLAPEAERAVKKSLGFRK